MAIRDDYGWWLPRSRPRPAKGGIKARSRRGRFGETWWARRWIEVLESFPIGARLARGQSYARKGQVLSIAVSKGRVTATVQGSARRPYEVVIELAPLIRREWGKITRRMAADLPLAAKLLAGELPDGVEEVFRACGVSLFPARERDLVTACNCPDLSNPCKHIAAVYYLLAEEFDRDPFLLVTLRGMEREELIELLGEGYGGTGGRRGTGRGRAATTARSAGPTADAGTEPDGKDVAPATRAADARPADPAPDPALARGSASPDPAAFWGTSPAFPPWPAPASDDAAAGTDASAADGAADASAVAGATDASAAGGSAAGSGAVAASLARSLGPFPFWQGSQPLLDRLEPLYVNASELARSLLAGEDVLDASGAGDRG